LKPWRAAQAAEESQQNELVELQLAYSAADAQIRFFFNQGAKT
jgi:hypothetical protein